MRCAAHHDKLQALSENRYGGDDEHDARPCWVALREDEAEHLRAARRREDVELGDRDVASAGDALDHLITQM